MKKIEAIVRKDKFDQLFQVLEKSGIGGMTVFDAMGFGHHRNGMQEKKKIEIYCDEFQVEKIVEILSRTVRTGMTGDGKIAVIDLENLYRIRSGEEGASAI